MVTTELSEVQTRLNSLGVRDVKLFFTVDARSMSNSYVSRQVAYLLSTYLAGDRVPLPLFGDSGN